MSGTFRFMSTGNPQSLCNHPNRFDMISIDFWSPMKEKSGSTYYLLAHFWDYLAITFSPADFVDRISQTPQWKPLSRFRSKCCTEQSGGDGSDVIGGLDGGWGSTR